MDGERNDPEGPGDPRRLSSVLRRSRIGLERLYAALGIPLPPASKRAMLDYVANKPKDSHGKHEYEIGDADTIAAMRAAFRPFQDYFGVTSEL